MENPKKRQELTHQDPNIQHNTNQLQHEAQNPIINWPTQQSGQACTVYCPNYKVVGAPENI